MGLYRLGPLGTIQVPDHVDNSAGTGSFSHGGGSSRLDRIIVAMAYGGTDEPSTPTWNGEGFSLVAHASGAASSRCAMWTLVPVSSGFQPFEPGTTYGSTYYVRTYEGVSGIRDTASGGGATNSPSLTLSPVDPLDVLIDVAEGESTLTVGAGQTQQVSGHVSTQSGASGGVMSWSQSSGHWAQVAIALIPSVNRNARTSVRDTAVPRMGPTF